MKFIIIIITVDIVLICVTNRQWSTEKIQNTKDLIWLFFKIPAHPVSASRHVWFKNVLNVKIPLQWVLFYFNLSFFCLFSWNQSNISGILPLSQRRGRVRGFASGLNQSYSTDVFQGEWPFFPPPVYHKTTSILWKHLPSKSADRSDKNKIK